MKYLLQIIHFLLLMLISVPLMLAYLCRAVFYWDGDAFFESTDQLIGTNLRESKISDSTYQIY